VTPSTLVGVYQCFGKNCYLTFRIGGQTWLYSYSKINQMHNISNLFYLGTTLYMFRTVSQFIIRSLRMYIQHKAYAIQALWLLASGNEMEFHFVPASKQSAKSVWHTPDAVCTVLDSWWWTERPSETCRVLLQNKINLWYSAFGWFYYRNILWFMVLQTSTQTWLLCKHFKNNLL